MKKIAFFVIASIGVLSCSKKNSEKVNLALHLDKGFEQTLVYTLSTEENKNGGMNESTEVRYKVDSVDKDGNYYLTGEIVRMSFNQKMFGESISYDSRDENAVDESGLAAEIKPVLNNPFTFKINKHGEIIEKQKFQKEVSGGLDAEPYNIIPLQFPRENIEVGFKWKENVANPLLKSAKAQTEYTYNGTNENRIEILLNSTITGIPMTKDSKIAGKFVFDSKTGILISGERTMPIQLGGGTATFKIIPVN